MSTRLVGWNNNCVCQLSRVLVIAVTLPATGIWAASADGQSQPTAAEPDTSGTRAFDDQHSAELGALVFATPGRGVLIADVMPGSPAAVGGLLPGDYLLALDGKAISTPGELQQTIQAKQPGTAVKVSFWRRGTTTEQEIVLAARSPGASRDEGRGWLGVMLQPSAEPGAQIAAVHPLGPAKSAGLRRGDLIVQIDGQKVTSIEEAIDRIEKLAPGTVAKLIVRRDGKEETVGVTLGDAIQALRRPLGVELLPPDWQVEDDRLEQTIEQLREELSELRGEVERLQGKAGHKDGANGSEAAGGSENGAANSNGAAEQEHTSTFVTQVSVPPRYYPPPRYRYYAPYPPYVVYSPIRPYRVLRPYPSYLYYGSVPYVYGPYPYTAYYPGPGVSVRVEPYVYFYWQ